MECKLQVVIETEYGAIINLGACREVFDVDSNKMGKFEYLDYKALERMKSNIKDICDDIKSCAHDLFEIAMKVPDRKYLAEYDDAIDNHLELMTTLYNYLDMCCEIYKNNSNAKLYGEFIPV